MQIRIASREDLGFIEGTYAHARAFMQANGNGAQWPDGYPSHIDAEEDIAHGHCFVVTDDEGLLAVFTLAPGPDETTPISRALGVPMPTTTSFTAWPRCVGVGSRGQFSTLRLSARITCAATPTRTTHRCGARLGPSDSANVDRSRSPTTRSASPTTGSNHH